MHGLNTYDFFNQPISSLKSIGPQRKFLLNQSGIFKIRHLLLFFPKKFLTQLEHVQEGEILIRITVLKKIKAGKIWIIKCIDAKNNQITLTSFHKKGIVMLFANRSYLIHGVAQMAKNGWEMTQPKVIYDAYIIDGGIPIYGTSVSNVVLHKIINHVIAQMPDDRIKSALYNIHNNVTDSLEDSFNQLKYLEAKLFAVVFRNKERYEKIQLNCNLIDSLPLQFKLNDDQLKVIEEIISALEGEIPLRHMLFAEVGAGKTVVALVVAILMIRAGYSVAFLAPTTALVQQHANWMIPFLEKLGISACLCEKKHSISNKQFVIGTHALLHSKERIENLGLVIVDEMQRFGVLQRAHLLSHASRKNLLMLSATPIPRSLNLLLEEFMTFSMIKTSVFKKDTHTSIISHNQIDEIIARIIESKKKTYWVMPSIEENEFSIGVIERAKYLNEHGVEKLAVLHGRMNDEQKLRAINDFRAGVVDCLVATTIVEIGIDIPDADIIVIENAVRFGLAQLHQLRGRVGRAGQKSYCMLIYQHYAKKLECLKKYADGFSIAQYDLEHRGGGRMLGLLQHGHDSCNGFVFLNLPQDRDILQQAVRKVEEISSSIDNHEAYDNSYDKAYDENFALLIEDTEIVH